MNARLLGGLALAREWCDRWKPEAELRQLIDLDGHPRLVLQYLEHGYSLRMHDVSSDSVLRAIHCLQHLEITRCDH